MPSGPDDSDDWSDEWDAPRTVLEAQPLGLSDEPTPPRPVELFVGYDAGKADGLRLGRLEGVYEVIHEVRAVLTAGKNAPEFIKTFTELLVRRCGVPWPPPPKG